MTERELTAAIRAIDVLLALGVNLTAPERADLYGARDYMLVERIRVVREAQARRG